MSQVTLKGTPIPIEGTFPSVGAKAPDFKLTNGKLEDVGLAAFTGKKKVLTINPSYDTSLCAKAAREFNQRVAGKQGVVVLAISADLPFAQERFRSTKGIDEVVTLSSFRSHQFAKDYGVLIAGGPMAGLTARSVLVLDANDKVVHAQLVGEITQEPDYEAALAALG